MDQKNMNLPRKSVDQPKTTDNSTSTILDLPDTNENNFLNNELNSPSMDQAQSFVPFDSQTTKSPAVLSVTENTQNPLESSINKLTDPKNLNQQAEIKISMNTLSHNDSITSSTPTTRSNIYYRCGNCGNRFIFNDLENKLVKCPHCSQISSISNENKQTNGIIFLLLVVVYFVLSASFAKDIDNHSSVFHYLISFIFFFVGCICALRAFYFFTIKVSSISFSSS